MTYPVIQTTSGASQSSSTVHNLELPSGIVPGDLIYVIICGPTGGTWTNPQGWTVQAQNALWDLKVRSFWKIADGTEGSYLTIQFSIAHTCIYYALRISNAKSADFEGAYGGTGYPPYDGIPDAPSCSPPWGAADTLWLDWIGIDVVQPSASPPANYTGNDGINDGTSHQISVAHRNRNAASEDPGKWSVSSATNWWAFNVAIEPGDPQAITATGIPSAEAFGTETRVGIIGFVTQVGAIASAEAFGTPRLTYRQDLTAVGGIASEQSFGDFKVEKSTVLLVGGVDISDGGVDISDHLASKSPVVTNAAHPQSGTFSFRLTGAVGDFDIDVEDEIEFRTEATVRYRGKVRSLTPVQPKPGYLTVDVTCQDFGSLLSDDVIVPLDAAPLGVPPGMPTNAGLTDYALIAWLLINHGTKGVSWTPYVGSWSDNLPTLDLLGKTLAEAMDVICDRTGGTWYVDFDKNLHYFQADVGEGIDAPFGLSDTPNGSTTFGYRDFAYPSESTDMRNRVFARGGIITADIRYLSQIASMDPTHYWRCGDTSGSLTDHTGSPVVLQPHGSVEYNYEGALALEDPSVRLADDYDFLSSSGNVSATGRDGWGIMAWVRPYAIGGATRRAIFSAFNGTDGWVFWYQTDQIGVTRYVGGSGVEAHFPMNLEWASPGWNIVAAYYDGTNLTCSSMLVGPGWPGQPNPVTDTRSTTTSQPLLVSFANGYQYGKLAVDEIVYVDRAMTYTEVYQALFTVYNTPKNARSEAWYQDDASVAAYGARSGYAVNDLVLSLADLDAFAAGWLASRAHPKRAGSLVTTKAGLQAGMNVEITNAAAGLSAEPLLITSVKTSYPQDRAPVYEVKFGDRPITLAEKLKDMRRVT